MFLLQLLGSSLADDMLVGSQAPEIGTPAVGIKAANPEGREQDFELQQCLVLPTTEDIRQYPARSMIQRLPQPARLFLATDKGIVNLMDRSLT